MSILRFGRTLTVAAAFAAYAVPAHAAAPVVRAAPVDTAVFAGGCFWGVQAVFERVKGVISSTSGYAGGKLSKPSYEQVSTGTTGHAESVRVVFDPSKVTYQQLLDIFFAVAMDPTQLNYQGPDHGTQYRSAVFFHSADQQRAAAAYIAKLTQQKTYNRPIVTEVSALNAFYPAEGYHQNFYDKNPNYSYIVINDKPKVDQLKARFPQMYQGK